MGKCCREIEVRIKISRLHFTIMRRIFDKNVFYYNNISIKKKKNTRKRNSFLAKEKGKKETCESFNSSFMHERFNERCLTRVRIVRVNEIVLSKIEKNFDPILLPKI